MLTCSWKSLAFAGAAGGLLLSLGVRVGVAENEAGSSAVVVEEEAYVPPAIALNLQHVIDHPPIGQGSARGIQDPVWEVRPPAGRSVVLLPIILTPGEVPYELSRSAIGLRSARFIGWYIPGPSGNSSSRSRGNASDEDDVFTVGDSRSLESLLLGEAADDPEGDAIEDAVDAAASVFDPVPDGAPRLARRLTVHPDGSVGWEAGRSFTGAEPKPASAQNLYGYKLDSEAMRNEEPPRPERLTRNSGESSRDFSQRRRDQQQQSRSATEEFRALRSAVRDLPDEFREAQPGIVFAVFNAPDRGEMSFTGIDWRIDEAGLAALGTISKGQNGAVLDANTLEAISQLNAMLRGGTAMDFRAAALAVYRGRLSQRIGLADEGYRLIESLIQSDDDIARKAAVSAVARTLPPTRASVELLAIAAETFTGGEGDLLKIVSLRSAFRLGANSGDGDALCQKVNASLADPNGPSAARVLEELLRAVEPDVDESQGNMRSGNGRDPRSGGRGGASADDVDVRMTLALINRINFDLIETDQQDQAIATVIRHASQRAVAAGWLDIKLLRASDDALIGRTLELLSMADAESSVVKPLASALRSMVFTAPAQGDDAAPALDLTLEGVIPITSSSHGLVVAVKSTDANRRAFAWRVMRHFEITGGDAMRGGNGLSDHARQAFDDILAAGRNEPKTPLYLVDFISNQREPELVSLAGETLIDLVIDEGIDREVALRAARKMVGTAQDFGLILVAMPSGKRGAAVARFYELVMDEMPAVVDLGRDPGQTEMVAWFGQQLFTGSIPTADEWAAQASEHLDLMMLLGSPDTRLAIASAHAMVINAGGDAQQADDFAQQIARLNQPTQGLLHDMWEPVQRDIYAEHLVDAAGPYRLTLTVYAASGLGNQGGSGRGAPNPRGGGRGGLGGRLEGPAEPNPGTITGEIETTVDLGIIDLKIEGDEVSLSVEDIEIFLAPERLAIRIAQVSSLTHFDNPELADLPLSQLAQPLDLLPIDGGVWVGSITLPDGRMLELTLTPED